MTPDERIEMLRTGLIYAKTRTSDPELADYIDAVLDHDDEAADRAEQSRVDG